MKLPSTARFADDSLKKAFEQLKAAKGDEKKLY